MPNISRERRRIRQHISHLSSRDAPVADRAERYLIRCYGSRALEPLLEACRNSDPKVRFRAVWALGYTHDPRAYEIILGLTDDPDEAVRYDATIALGILGDDRAIEPLTRMYLRSDVTRPAGNAFARMGPKTVPALAAILRQGSAEVRHSVVNVLGGFAQEHSDQTSIALLREYTQDPDPDVRTDATFWLNETAATA